MKTFEEKIQNTAKRLNILPEQVPQHIAIIMDGNGRWAQEKGKPRGSGHRRGGRTVEKIALCGVALGVRSMTLYSFSTENWKRPQKEIDGLMYLYRRYLVGIRSMLKRNDVRLVHLGQREPMPKNVLKELDKTMELTAKNRGMVLGLALNYSGRTELGDAAKKIGQLVKDGKLDPADIDENTLTQNLYIPDMPDPDLLIRTANEKRVSNFLLWQIAYSEFHVTETLWPDFNEKDMDIAILDYAARQRRYGGLK